MTLYQHRFGGSTAAGETWMFSWWADSARSIATAQAEAVQWITTLWNGASAGNGYQDHINAGVVCTAVTTVEVTMATGLQQARVDGAVNLPGVATGNPLPADVALVVSLRTATANRQGRGRFYLPQPAVSQVTLTGRVLGDLITDLGSSLTAAWAGYNTATDRPVVYSRTSHLTRQITTFDIGDLFDTQRRREANLIQARTSSPMP